MVKNARSRLNELIRLSATSNDLVLKSEALKLAIMINSKYNLKQSFSARKGFCKKCYSVFLSSKDYRIRLKNNRRVINCINCGFSHRFKY